MFYLLALAFLLRLVLLNQSLWLDEAIQALALMGKMGPLLTYALADFQPPLYHGLLWLWTNLFGYSEQSLRFPSVLAGVGTVYFVAQLGNLLGGKKLRTLAGLLAATNPLLIYYSQEGRTYGLTTFLVTAALYFFARLLTDSSRRNLLYYTLTSVLFLWTSYLSWFLHFALFLYSLACRRRDLVLSQLLSASTLLLWLPSLLSSLGVGLSTLSSAPEWGNVVGGISLKALALTWVKANLGRISFDSDVVYALLVLGLFLLHFAILSRLNVRQLIKTSKLFPLLLVWLSALPLTALVSLLLPVYSYTRVLFIIPAYLLTLALALRSLPRLYSLLVISVQCLALFYFWFNPVFHREAWRSVVSEAGAQATYALPSRNQSAPLEYYGVSPEQIIEPKLGVTVSPNRIVYLKYVESVFDPARLGPANLERAGYTRRGEQVYPGLQVESYENHN